MLNKLKKNYFLIISTFLIIYFFFNFLGGERGLFSYFEKKNLLANLHNKEIEIIKKTKDLEFKNSLLTNKIKNLEFKNSLLSDKLDLDYIETLIREKFLFGKEGETLYIIKSNEN